MASAVSIVANYAFLLAAGRTLGSDDYGSLAALLGLLAIALIPAGALQMGLSREVSRRLAGVGEGTADAFARRAMRLALVATMPLVGLALLVSPLLAPLLNIDSTGVVALATASLVTALVFPVAMGTLQGQQRFHALAALYVIPFLLRLALFGGLAAAGYRLGGALLATLLSGVASTLLAVALLRDTLRPRRQTARPSLRPFLRYLVPVLVGLVGIALLTNVDLLVVKARFSGEAAGAYGAASAFARVAFFIPATILAVLFPRTAARQARGEQTEDILGRSLIVTAGFCGLLALAYLAVGEGLLVTTFGQEFALGGDLVAGYAAAIGLYSIAHVLVGYHLSRGEPRYAWIVAAGVVLQVAVLATVPASLQDVVWANLAVGAVLLLAHEVLVGSSLPALRAGAAHFAASAGVRVRRIALEGIVVLGGATAVVCLLFLPLVVHLGSTVIGDPGSDSAGTVAWLWRLDREGGYHLFGTTHHTLIGAPFGWDEGNGLNLQWLVPYYPAYLASKVFGEVAAYNLALLSGYVLSGSAMYLLVRYLGCARLVAAWAGLVYVLFPWHLVRTPHASLTHLEFLPLLIAALVGAARRPGWARFALVGATVVACWLTSGYFGAMAVVIAAAFSLGAAFTLPAGRRLVFVAGSVVSALGASFLVALGSVLSGVGRGAGLERVAGDLSTYGLRPFELVLPAADNVLFGSWTRPFLETHFHGSNPTETTNYVGLLTIALAAAWLVVARRRRERLSERVRVASLGLPCVAVAALLLAAPSPWAVFGYELSMPSRFLWDVVPAFRVPSRWVVTLMTALVPLGGLTLQALWVRLEGRSRGPLLAVAAVGAAVAVSVLELLVPPATPRFRTNAPPAQYAAVERTPPGILAEYPLVDSADYKFWQRIHGRRLFNGGYGFPFEDVQRALLDPGAPGTAEQLALLGVTSIVTDAGALDFTEDVPDVPNADWGPGYSLAARLPDRSSVWRVTARPAPALVTLPSGFGDPVPPRPGEPRPSGGGLVGYPLVSSSGVGYVGLRTREPQVVRLSFDATPPDGRQATLRVSASGKDVPFTLNGRTHVSLLVALPRGASVILLKTDPAPTSEADAIVLSAPRVEQATGTPTLQAEELSADPGY